MKSDARVKIAENDYEIYKIPLPLKAIWKNQKEKYLSCELSKIHPCFSDDSRFDWKLSLSKKGFSAKVIVMNNYTLKQYQKTPGKFSLYSSEFKNKALFKTPFWTRKKILSCIAFIVFISLSLLLLISPGKKSSVGKTVTESVTATTDGEKNVQKPFESLKCFLGSIKQNGGEITSFEWKLNGLIEEINLSIEKLYPESITAGTSDIKFSTLNFNNGKPCFSVTSKNKVSGRFNSVNNQKMPKTEIRQLIELNGGKLLSETVTPYEIKFDISLFSKSNNLLFLEQLDSICSSCKLFPEKIAMVRQKDGITQMIIRFSKYFPEQYESLFLIINENLRCFGAERVKTPERKTETQKKKRSVNIIQSQTSKTVSVSEEKKKNESNFIGKVIHEDGSISAFYRGKDGKIEIKNQK